MATKRNTKRRDEDRCTESALYQNDQLRLERDANGNPIGVVNGVRVINRTSPANRRIFSDRAHKDIADQINTKTIRVNLNHTKSKSDDFAPPDPDVLNRFARLFDAKVVEEGVTAKMKYNPKHHWGPAFEWFVENDPAAIGLSVDALFRGPYTETGERSVESVPKLYCVDIVGDPGSTNSLFEDSHGSEGNENRMPEDMGGDAALDMSDLEDGDEGAGNSSASEGVEHLCNYIKSLVAEGKVEEKALLETVMAALKGAESEDEDEDDGEDKDSDEGNSMSDKAENKNDKTEKVESKQEQKGQESANTSLTPDERLELDTFRAKEAFNRQRAEARTLCEKANLPAQLVTDVFLDTLVHRGKESWESMIADRRVQVGLSNEPRSAGRTPGAEPTVDDFISTVLKGDN